MCFVTSLPFYCPSCLLSESLDQHLSLLFPPFFSSPLVSPSPQAFSEPQLPHTCLKRKD